MTVKSTFQARDLLYRFNALSRLQDVHDPPRGAIKRVMCIRTSRCNRSAKPSAAASRTSCSSTRSTRPTSTFRTTCSRCSGAFGFDIDEMPAEEHELSLAAQKFGRRVQGNAERAAYRCHHQQPREAVARAFPAPLPVHRAEVPGRREGARDDPAQEPRPGVEDRSPTTC